MLEEEGFDKQRNKRGDDSKPLTIEEKKLIKEREERDRVRAENSKQESLKPFNEFVTDPLKTIEYLCSQGDFAGSYNKRMELFTMITLIKIQNALESLVSILSKKK